MSSPQPLQGIKVYELGNSVAAPYATLILGELGADVIKVEAPGGDHARGWGPPFVQDGSAAYFVGLNRNKRSIVVDFNDRSQRKVLFDQIALDGDVVICNLRSGVAGRFGLDAPSLRAVAPNLIYCDIGAFGSSGPRSNQPGYDPLMQATSGIMSVTGEGWDRPPVRVGVSLIDMGAGLWAVIAVLAALLQRKDTNVGEHVETSLLEVAAAYMNLHVTGYLASGEIRMPYGSGVAEIVPYQAFRTADSWLMVAAGNDRLFQKLCVALELRELMEDPRCATNADRVNNRNLVVAAVQQRLAAKATKNWSETLTKAGVPNAPIQNVPQFVDDPQLQALGILQQLPDGSPPTMGLPISFGKVRPPFRFKAPRLGEHTREILASPKRE